MVKTSPFGCRTRKRPYREAERTETYVSIHDKGADKVLRPFLTLVENVAIWMKCKESACGMDRSVLGRT